MTDTKELDELLQEYREICFLVRDSIYNNGDQDKAIDLLAHQNVLTKQKLLAYISKHYISKSEVERALADDGPLDHPKSVTRNQLRQQIRKELGV